MSNSREERAEQKREDILDAALQVFTEKGFHAAGIADIAAKVGIGHGTCYRYFKNKRDIFDALVMRTLVSISRVIDDEPPTTDSLAEYESQLYRIADQLFGIFASDPRLGRILLFEAPAVDPLLQKQFNQAMTLMAGFTRQYLDNGVQKNFLRADTDTDVVAKGINAVIFEGIREISCSKTPDKEGKRWIQQGVPLMLRGIAA